MSEQTRQPRHRTLKGAKIAFNLLSSTVDCTVRNMSDGGALLKVPNVAGIPDRFTLILPQEGVSRECTVRWRKTSELGVAFD